jgi:hypothetical protein
MSNPYTGAADSFPEEITTITDNDEPSGNTFSTPLEQLADRSVNTIQRVVVRTGETYTIPELFVGMRVQMIGPGGAGGDGGTTGGGGGGGPGQYIEFFVGRDDTILPAGTVLTALNTPGTDFQLAAPAGFGMAALCGNDGSDAVTTTGGAGASGDPGSGTGAGGAAGADGQPGGNGVILGGGGGGGSAAAAGGAGADNPFLNNGNRPLAGVGVFGAPGFSGGAGATVDGTQGAGGKGFGAGGGGGGGSSTGRGGGGAGGLYVPEFPAQTGVGGNVSTAGGAGSAGVAVLTVYRGGGV